MSFKLKSLSTVHRYQSDIDPDKGTDKAVTFLIRTLPRKEAMYLRSLLRNDILAIQSGKEVVSSADRPDVDLESFRLGVCGWENLTGEDGKPVEFRKDPDSVFPAVHPDLIDMFPVELIGDISKNAVWAHNFPSQEAAKN